MNIIKRIKRSTSTLGIERVFFPSVHDAEQRIVNALSSRQPCKHHDYTVVKYADGSGYFAGTFNRKRFWLSIIITKQPCKSS